MKKKESTSTKEFVEKVAASKAKSPLAKKYGDENWKRAEQITAKESGSRSTKSVPYGLVVTIAKNAKKANKTIKKSSVEKTSKSKAAEKYKTDTNSKRKK